MEYPVQQQQQQWAASATTWSAAPQPSYPHHQPTTLEEIRTLWIGDLQFWIDENYLNTCFAHTNEGMDLTDTCIFCNKMEEDEDHCPFTSKDTGLLKRFACIT